LNYKENNKVFLFLPSLYSSPFKITFGLINNTIKIPKARIVRTRLIIVIIILALFVAAVNVKSFEKANAEPVKTVNTIRIGTVDVDAVTQMLKFQPTADYIAAKLSNETTQYKGQVIIPSTINDMIELLREQRIDLYFESPFTIAIVDNESGAVPFLLRWKEGVTQYHSLFIVKNSSSIKTVNDFGGKTIAFEAPESTSGYLLPKAYLVQKGFKLIGQSLESYLAHGEPIIISKGPNINSSNIDWSSKDGSNDGNNTIRYIFAREDHNIPLWVVEGKADIGVISNVDLEHETYESIKSQLKIVDKTIDVPRHMVSYRSELEPDLVYKINSILLNMDKEPEGIKILRNFDNSTKYEEIPNKDQLFGPINNMLPLLEQKEVEVGG
jgi:phosphate/phosphite/phosphonate ABC transporter binding protein